MSSWASVVSVSSEEGRLPYSVGDVLEVTAWYASLTRRETDSPGWGYGSLNGTEGYFVLEDVAETYPSVTYVAICSYDATTDNQLSFKEGESIEVMGDPENGWSYGRYSCPHPQTW